MTQPFDHSRYDWYPPGLGGPGQVQSSNGSPRPALRVPLDTFVVHYAGAGTSWLDYGDTVAELRGVELNHARPQGKPNEYNSVSDSAAETWEYAGRFQAAHAAPHNLTTWGHLVLYGLERITAADADGLIRGVRRARAQAQVAGYVANGHFVVGHGDLPGKQTSCPGPLRTNLAWWARITAPLTAADYGPPVPLPNPQPPASEEDDMPAQIVVDTKLKGTFACVGGRWVPWLVPIPPGVPVFTGDHVWTREQILADQGEPAEALWRERAAKK